MATRRKLFLFAVAFLAVFGTVTVGAQRPAAADGARNICGTCKCSPDNVAPLTVECVCSKTMKSKVLIIRDQDAAVLSSARELTLASCGFVSLPSYGLSGSRSLSTVTVRDLKMFHYTAGLFPALENLTVEDVGELVLDGFGPANRTLRNLTVRQTTVVKLVAGTVTAAAPLTRVLLDRVTVEEIETGALDMVFVDRNNNNNNGQSSSAAAAAGFIVVNSTIKSVQTGAVTVRSGAVTILNNTLDELAAGAVVVQDARGGFRMSGNRLGSMAGDSVTARDGADDERTAAAAAAGGDEPWTYRVDGNAFAALPANMQLLTSDRAVAFRDNVVDDVDMSPFLFGLGPAVRVAGNRFVCDCDPKRVSVLKFDHVFPGLQLDNRFDRLLADNHCRPPVNVTLAGYKELLVKELACKGSDLGAPPSPPPGWTDSRRGSNDTAAANAGGRAAVPNVFLSVVLATAAAAILYG